MTLKLYVHETNITAPSAGPQGSWNTTITSTFNMLTAFPTSNSASGNSGGIAVNPHFVGCHYALTPQFTSAGTVSGSASGVLFVAQESTATVAQNLRLYAWIATSTGSLRAAAVSSAFVSANTLYKEPFNTFPPAFAFSGLTFNGASAQVGDRLVVEVGSSVPSTLTNQGTTFRGGRMSSGDAVDNNTGTGAGFINFTSLDTLYGSAPTGPESGRFFLSS